LFIVLLTNNPAIVGDKTNAVWLNVLSWVTVVAIFSASAGLIVSWFL
jgi:Mn2+/Fe2+ NRAMP family transporter